MYIISKRLSRYEISYEQTRLRMIWVFDTCLTDIPCCTRPVIVILNHTHTKKIPTITCSKYVLSWFHENSLSHNFAKRRTETTHKNPVIIFRPRMTEYIISVILRTAWYWTMMSDFWDARYFFVWWTFKNRDFIQISMIISWSLPLQSISSIIKMPISLK